MNNVNINRIYFSFLDYGDMKSGKRSILPPPSLLMFERCNLHDIPLKHGILLPDYMMFRPSNVQCDIDRHGDLQALFPSSLQLIKSPLLLFIVST